MKGISRRQFLVGTAAGAAGIASAGMLNGCSSKAGAEWDGTYKAGSYKASAPGRFGDVVVEISFGDQAIESMSAVGPRETPSIAGSAFTYVPAAIVDGQTLNVAAVSGATFTSNAILAAAADCVQQAGGDAEALKAASPAPASKAVAAGTYTAVAHGHHSDVEVETTLGSSDIKDVKIVSSGETYNLSFAATETLPQSIVQSQSIGVSTVSGATFTSRAIMTAVADCIEQAGGMQAVRGFNERIARAAWPTTEKTVDTDVVVVGSGLAGIAAALSAQENGAKVALVEKMPYFGGISQTSGGAIVASVDESDKWAESFSDYMLHQHCGIMQGETMDAEYPNKDLLHVLAKNSYPDIKWLQSMGAQFYSIPQVPNSAGQPQYFISASIFVAGTEAVPNTAGKNFETMLDGFVKRGGQIYLEASAKSLIVGSDGKVAGVKTAGKDGNLTFNAKAVILCAGGFGADELMVEEYAPSYEHEYNVTLVGNVGDGIRMATDIGAAAYDTGILMGEFGHTIVTDYDMIHPYEDHETPSSAIFVNPLGWRVNSETPVVYTAGTTYVNPDPTTRDYYWAITNKGILATQPDYAKILKEQLDAGNERFFTAATKDELARLMKINPTTLRYTLNRYNRFCAVGSDTDLFKAPEFLVPFTDEGPWYAVKCEVEYFGTVGGLKINTDAAVLDTNGTPIKGLHAAGENANRGFFNLNYVGGRSLTVCLVMGRIAGANAAKA